MDPVPDHGEDSWVGAQRLQGVRALITGGDSGIGRAVAIAFAREGADVALGYLPQEQDDAEMTADWVERAGRTAVLCPADISDRNNFTVNLAAEVGSRGIRVNAVAPGPIWTPLQPANQSKDKIEAFGADTPMGRAGQPAELAGAFVFLASPREASYVSGTLLGVTGGKPVF